MHGRICLLILAVIVGCTDTPTPPPSETVEPKASLAFDAKATGTIRGVVRWDGDVPVAAEQVVRAHATHPYLYQNPARFKLPHYPTVDANSHGIENAVVFLRKVEAQYARPWGHAPVRVEIAQRQLRIAQGDRRTSVGFVRRGDTIELVNRDVEYHNVIGRGAAFFAEPLIEKDRVSKRTLSQPGIVDLRSGNGYYWLNAHLFVAEHPYFTCTDRVGRFQLEQVPAGSYELVCWHPSWHVQNKERDPETGIVTRLVWAAPKEQTRTIEVRAGEQVDLNYHWSMDAFK